MTYNKLVRDRIVEHLNKLGKNPVAHKAGYEERWQKLQEKLLEEVNEFLQAKEGLDKDGELIDIIEVVDAILDYRGPLVEEWIKNRRKEKAKEKGRFYEGIILEKADL